MSDLNLNILDRMIGYFSPTTLAERVKAKEQIRAYEGASLSHRTSDWKNLSSQLDEGWNRSVLRSRARDLVRNNSYASRGIQIIQQLMISEGVIPSAKVLDGVKVSDIDLERIALNIGSMPPEVSGVLRDSSLDNNKKLEKIIDLLFYRFTKQCDAYGESTFAALCNQVARTTAETGEAFVRKRYQKIDPKEGVYIPLSLQVMESDYLDDQVSNNNTIYGITFNDFGRRESYRMYVSNPNYTNSFNAQTEQVPASEILHVYKADRPGQIVGVTWLAPAMIKLRELDKAVKTEILRMTIATCMTTFVTGAGRDIFPGLNSSRLEPGQIVNLPEGSTVQNVVPSATTGFKEFHDVSAYNIASALGISHASLTSDYSNVNFTSGRMAEITVHNTFKMYRDQVIIDKFAEPVYNWFLSAIEDLGINVSYIAPEWNEPRMNIIDPVKEAEALKIQLENGMITLADVHRMLGKDYDDTIAELAKETAEFKDKELNFAFKPEVLTQNTDNTLQQDTTADKEESARRLDELLIKALAPKDEE